MVKVEAVRIGESPAAPLFTQIVGPSNESRDVGQTKKEIAERYGIRRRWWSQLIERSAPISTLHSHISPSEYSWIGASSGIRGLNFNYGVTQDECVAELYIDRGKEAEEQNKMIFDQLHEHRDAIESAFGDRLQWQRLEGKRACRIRFACEGGYRSPEEHWPRIQEQIILGMKKLEQSFRPWLNQLRIAN